MTAPRHSSHATLNPAPEPPPVSPAMARAHRIYWRFNLVLITTLMTLGFIVSFVLPLLAPVLSAWRIGGFRLPFYFGAQGAILVYLALIVAYIVLMQYADRRLQRAFDADISERKQATASLPENDRVAGSATGSATGNAPERDRRATR